MKNLNKKIGVVVLSGLVLAGSGLASSSLIFADQGQGVWIGEVYFAQNPLLKSKYESPWPLAKQAVVEKDLEHLLKYESAGNILGFKIVGISENGKHGIQSIPYHGKVDKYFDNVKQFESHLFNIGMPKGSYIINIAGVRYIMQFYGM